MVLADAVDPSVIIPVIIFVTGVIGSLILKGNVHTDAEMRERLAEQQQAHAKEIDLMRKGYEDSSKMQRMAHDFQIQALTERMDGIASERDAVAGERDAWKCAAEWNSDGRVEAQRASAALLEAGNVSGVLLGFVREQMSEKRKQGSDD